MAGLFAKLQTLVPENRYLEKMMWNMYLLEFTHKIDDFPKECMDDLRILWSCSDEVM